MTERIDLLKIAQAEQNGTVFEVLDGIYKRSKVQPRGFTDAVIWEGGSTHGGDEKDALAALPKRFKELGVDAVISGMAC